MGKIINLFREEVHMLNVFDVAQALLNIQSMSNKKLQKLCYYVQAWYLALNREPLFENSFEAWIHGPVCPELYHKFKNYGFTKIPQSNDLPSSIANDEYLNNFIHNVFEMYGDMSGDELEELTHQEFPWLNARRGLDGWQSSNNIISCDDMIEYYSNLYDN